MNYEWNDKCVFLINEKCVQLFLITRKKIYIRSYIGGIYYYYFLVIHFFLMNEMKTKMRTSFFFRFLFLWQRQQQQQQKKNRRMCEERMTTITYLCVYYFITFKSGHLHIVHFFYSFVYWSCNKKDLEEREKKMLQIFMYHALDFLFLFLSFIHLHVSSSSLLSYHHHYHHEFPLNYHAIIIHLHHPFK